MAGFWVGSQWTQTRGIEASPALPPQGATHTQNPRPQARCHARPHFLPPGDPCSSQAMIPETRTLRAVPGSEVSCQGRSQDPHGSPPPLILTARHQVRYWGLPGPTRPEAHSELTTFSPRAAAESASNSALESPILPPVLQVPLWSEEMGVCSAGVGPVCCAHTALSIQHSAPTQHSAHRSPALSMQHLAPSTQHPALSTQILRTQIPSTQHPTLSTQHPALLPAASQPTSVPQPLPLILALRNTCCSLSPGLTPALSPASTHTSWWSLSAQHPMLQPQLPWSRLPPPRPPTLLGIWARDCPRGRTPRGEPRPVEASATLWTP